MDLNTAGIARYTGLVCGGCSQAVAVILNGDSDDILAMGSPNCGEHVDDGAVS